MEQIESVPFSSLIAGMLLLKSSYTTLETAQILCYLEGTGIEIDEENDDFSKLYCCVKFENNYGFRLKNGMMYDTVLYSGDTVLSFLKENTDDMVLSFLNDYFKQKTDSSRIEDCVKNNLDKKNKIINHNKKKVLTKSKKFVNLGILKK